MLLRLSICNSLYHLSLSLGQECLAAVRAFSRGCDETETPQIYSSCFNFIQCIQGHLSYFNVIQCIWASLVSSQYRCAPAGGLQVQRRRAGVLPGLGQGGPRGALSLRIGVRGCPYRCLWNRHSFCASPCPAVLQQNNSPTPDLVLSKPIVSRVFFSWGVFFSQTPVSEPLVNEGESRVPHSLPTPRWGELGLFLL